MAESEEFVSWYATRKAEIGRIEQAIATNEAVIDAEINDLFLDH